MRFEDLEGIAGESADEHTLNERTFLSEMTRGVTYGPSDIVGIGFAETSGSGEKDEFSSVFLTSRGLIEWRYSNNNQMDIAHTKLSDMGGDLDINDNCNIELILQRVDEFGNPIPQFINFGSEKYPYVLALYVRQPKGI